MPQNERLVHLLGQRDGIFRHRVERIVQVTRLAQTSPANVKNQFWHGVDWWGKVGSDNKTEAERQTERYAAWMLRRG